jgi:hypothetical protein
MALNLAVNLGAVDLWDPTKGGTANPPPGAYEVVTKEVDVHAKGDKKSIKVVSEITSLGMTVETYLGLDTSKPSNAQKIKTALVSHGANAEKVRGTTQATLTDAMFVGRKAYMIVKKVDGVDEKGREKLNDRDFCTAEQFKAYSDAQSKVAGTPPPANGAGAPAAAGVAGLFD